MDFVKISVLVGKIHAGTMKELDYAIITVWGDGGQSAYERKGEFIDHIKSLFSNGLKK